MDSPQCQGHRWSDAKTFNTMIKMHMEASILTNSCNAATITEATAAEYKHVDTDRLSLDQECRLFIADRGYESINSFVKVGSMQTIYRKIPPNQKPVADKIVEMLEEFGWVITTPVGKIVEDENFDLKMKSIADYIGIKHYSAN